MSSRGGRTSGASEARVRSFATVAVDDADGLSAHLAARRAEQKLGRAAWVTVWGLRSAQQFLRLPPAKPADLEALAAREARKDIAPLETDGDRASLGIMLGGEVVTGTHRRREVSMVAVSTSEVLRRIQPVTDAGFVVEGVLTPGAGVDGRRPRTARPMPGTAGAFVALGSRATCLAIVRDGLLLFSRELPWGYDADAAPDAVGARLASELRRSVLFFKQTFRASVDHVGLCGDMPNLRALTAPLGEALNIPVQTADSLTGIDAHAVPEPAERFRAEIAALRLIDRHRRRAGSASQPAAVGHPGPSRVARARRSPVRHGRREPRPRPGGVRVRRTHLGAVRRARRHASSSSSQTIEPEARRLDELRKVYTLARSQGSALAAFDAQGPRLARLLEALSAAAPEEIILSSVKAEADGMVWNTTVNGIAVTPDAASGQAAVNALIRSLAKSPYAGAPVHPPSFRMVSGSGGATGTSGERTRVVAEGMSGVEFVLQLRVAR